MSSEAHPHKVPGNEPFESETEIEEQPECGDGIFGQLHQPVWGQYCEDDLRGMIVRGINFMSDKKKIDCGPALFKLMHVDIFKTKPLEDRCAHFAAHRDSWASQRWEKQQARAAAIAAGTPVTPLTASQLATSSLASDPLAPLIIINFLIPGSNNDGMNLVLYFARRIKPAAQLKKLKSSASAASSSSSSSSAVKSNPKSPPPASSSSASAAGAKPPCASDWESPDFPHDLERIGKFDHLLEKFLAGTDDFRDGRLKIVPRIAEGSYLVKKFIGRVPAILGKKVKQLYYRNVERNYIEIDADLGSSMMAGRIISMVKGTAKGLVVDLSFLLQGDTRDELPESLLGGVRMIKVDLDKITFLSDNNKQNVQEFDF